MNRIIDGHPLRYWQQNAEEDYITTPISVLAYIDKLEQLLSSPTQTIYPRDEDFKKLEITFNDGEINITASSNPLL